MISHADVSLLNKIILKYPKNIQMRIQMKAKEMRQKGIEAYNEGNREQAKYYLQRMREL